MNMTDGNNYACPFCGCGCDHRAGSFGDLKVHVIGHPNTTTNYQEVLGMFWGPIIRHSLLNREWTVVGSISKNRLTRVLELMRPLDREDAQRYWSNKIEEFEELEDIAGLNEKEEEARGEEEINNFEARRSRPPVLLLPDESPQVSPEGRQRPLIEEILSEEQKRVVVGEELQIWINQLQVALSKDEIGDVKRNLEEFL
jgi:hypothetical protein